MATDFFRIVVPGEVVVVHGLDWPRTGRIGSGILGRVTHISEHGIRMTCYDEHAEDFSGLDYYIAWVHIREMPVAPYGPKTAVLMKQWLSSLFGPEAASDENEP